ncbi:MAG: energy transducer TonB [Cycloclasticus sp.]
MSSTTYSWGTLVYKPKSALLFILISLIVHAALAAFAYKTGIFATEDIDSMPAKRVSVLLTEPTPVTPPPIQPIKPKPKVIKKRKVVTQAPSPKKISVKPVKKVIKPVPPKIIPKKAASPLPVPVSKPATFTSPQPTYQPKPKYPSIARRRGTEGIVIFEISVANDGHVNQAIIIQSSGSSALDRSALKTIKTWQFPASRFNSLSTFKQKIEFRLNAY